MGLQPKGQISPKDAVMRIENLDPKERLITVVKKFPRHVVRECLYCIGPFLFALIPIFVGGSLARSLLEDQPGGYPVEPTTLDTMEQLETSSHSTTTRSLMWMKAAMSSVALYLFPATYLCTLWNWRPLLKPVLLSFLLPGFLIDISLTMSRL